MANPDFVQDSILGRLRDIYTSIVALLTGIVLAAGTARIGTVSGVLKTVSVTKALAAAAIYHAEDVLSENASTGTDWDFTAIARANGAKGYITKVQAISETTAVTPRLTLYLFNAAPTSAVNDHAANTAPIVGDLAKYIGKVDLPAMEDLGTGMSTAVATPGTTGNLPLEFECASDADDILGILACRDAFTQVATKNMTVRVTAEQY